MRVYELFVSTKSCLKSGEQNLVFCQKPTRYPARSGLARYPANFARSDLVSGKKPSESPNRIPDRAKIGFIPGSFESRERPRTMIYYVKVMFFKLKKLSRVNRLRAQLLTVLQPVL